MSTKYRPAFAATRSQLQEGRQQLTARPPVVTSAIHQAARGYEKRFRAATKALSDPQPHGTIIRTCEWTPQARNT